MVRVFFFYCHADEYYRNELEKHLISLKHQGLIESWHDRKIIAGEEWDRRINDELGRANVILLLISSDFIASKYCYELEMTEAIKRHDHKAAIVIPVILRPCDWTELPFGKLHALPKDGKPVSTYTSLDEAFLEITEGVGNAAKSILVQRIEFREPIASNYLSSTNENLNKLARSSNLAIPKLFTDHDINNFVTEAFDYIASYFEYSLEELNAINSEINTKFQMIDALSFEAIAYRNGNQICKCGIWLGDAFRSKDSSEILFCFAGVSQRNSFNEIMSVKDNGNMLGLEALGISYNSREKKLLTFEGAAEHYWTMFFEPMQRGYK
jgi:hypothetical protein